MGIGAATITRPLGRLLTFLAALAVFASLLLLFAPTVQATSTSNETAHWKAAYPNAVDCYKYDPPGKSTVHGSLTQDGKAVVLNDYKPLNWPGNHWEVLIVNAANTDIVTPHPIAGVQYTAPGGADVSHWIVCKGLDPEPEPGNIVVVKEVTDGSSTSEEFLFAASYTADFKLKHGEQNQSGDLAAGTYSVLETVPTGWDLVSAVCESDGTDAVINPREIDLSEGETVTCTFTNDEIPPEPGAGLIIVKKEVTEGSSTSEEFLFAASYTADFKLKHGEQNQSGDLAAGTYSVLETVPTGWDLVSATCVSTDEVDQSTPGAIDLSEGETVTCTFVNRRTPPPPEPGAGLIIVKKEVTEGSSTSEEFLFAASYTADFKLKHGEQNQSGDLAAGTYSVLETVPTGWDLVSATCVSTDEVDQSTPGAIDLSEGETVTCTFVNDVPEDVSPTSIVNTTAPEASPETLPFTGADSGPHAALALLLVAAGALALVGARVFRADTEE